jgi:hypothetical protein
VESFPIAPASSRSLWIFLPMAVVLLAEPERFLAALRRAAPAR